MTRDDEAILVLYYKPTCPYCQKVLDYLEEIGKDVSLKNINDDPKAKEELLHLGGKAQVPCLFIDGKPLYESADIIDWLKEKNETVE